MNVPDDLHALMADVVDGLIPQPPPLTTLQEVARRRRRRALTAGAAVAALVLVGAGWATVGLAGGSASHIVRVGPAGPGPATSSPPRSSTRTSPASCTPSQADGVVAIPDVVGMTLSQAERDAQPDGGVTITAETSRSVSLVTVVAQTPTPGTLAAVTPTAGAVCNLSPADVSVTIALPPTSRCSSAQLALTFRGTAAMTGDTFAGNFTIRDTAPVWCAVSGPIRVVGLDGAGRQVTQTVAVSVPHPFALSADTPPIAPTGLPENYIDINIMLIAAPTGFNGTCAASVTPASWQITLPGPVQLRAANLAPQGEPGNQSLITCGGALSVGGAVQLNSP